LAELKPASFWARLLKLVDDELSEPHDLVIVGGAAIGLRYAATHLTSDLDSVSSLKDRPLWAAFERAGIALQQEQGLRRPPKVSAIGDAPRGYDGLVAWVEGQLSAEPFVLLAESFST
jgi:hypothetical protein